MSGHSGQLLFRRYASEGHIPPFVIIGPEPVRGELLDLIDGFKQVLGQPVVADRLVVAFDIRAPLRLLRLDMLEPDAASFRPTDGSADIFRPFIAAKNLWLATPLDDLLQRCLAATILNSSVYSFLLIWQLRVTDLFTLHSDRGTQFKSGDYQRFLKRNMLICSMSTVGHCSDNAAYEGFFGALKRERTHDRRYHTHNEMRAKLFNYIERFHNPRIRHRIARQDQAF